MKIAINGFGRIGRLVARNLFNNPQQRKNLQLVAVNDLSSPETHAFLLRHDSTHGKFAFDVKHDAESLTIDGQRVGVLAEKDPSKLPWAKLGVDVVLECTGALTKRDTAAVHMTAGAKKVIVSAPCKGADKTVVMGVNHESYDPSKHSVLSNASCTTNCLAPVVHVLHKKWGIEQGFITTVHSYTSDQRLLDNKHSDPRRARAAALSMIPTTTGAAKAVGEVIPDLKGKLDGMAVRVPTPNVSLTDLVAELKVAVSKDEVNAALKEAAAGALRGVLHVEDEPLVSCDFNGNLHSSIVDAACTNVIAGADGKGKMVKVYSWYDNEVGFSERMLDLAVYLGKRGF